MKNLKHIKARGQLKVEYLKNRIEIQKEQDVFRRLYMRTDRFYEDLKNNPDNEIDIILRGMENES
jgi:hypothetical protein